MAQRTAIDKDGVQLRRLVAGTPAARSVAGYIAAIDRFEASAAVALKRSRAETARNAEDRSGSRDYWTNTVDPRSDQVRTASAQATAAVDRLSSDTAVNAGSSASSDTRLIWIVALLALAVAVAAAVWVTRSVTRPVRALGERLASLDEASRR